MKKYLVILLAFPLFLFASTSQEYAELFGEKFERSEIEECSRILEEWRINCPEDDLTIQALQATILLAEGKLSESTSMMETILPLLEREGISSKTADLVRDYYQKAWDFEGAETSLAYSNSNENFHIEFCKNKQPKGTKFKYWFGVAQIVAGCLAAPFSGGTSTALIIAGVATTASAVSDSLNNMEQWEDDLNRRQRIGTENASPEQTSYVPAVRLNSYNRVINA